MNLKQLGPNTNGLKCTEEDEYSNGKNNIEQRSFSSSATATFTTQSKRL